MHLPTEITNPKTGERISFDETASADERLVWNEFRPANLPPPPAHYHPNTEERFAVREGRLIVDFDGNERRVEADEKIVVPPMTPHVSYTGAESARFRREVSPPGQWRAVLTDRFAAAHAVGELSGLLGFLQSILLLQAYPDVVVPERPPRTVQRVLFPVLGTAARAIGLKPHYPYPRDDSADLQDASAIRQEDSAILEEYKDVVQKYPRAVSSGDFAIIDEICTEDVVSHAPLGEPRGREAHKEYEAPINDAFPDFDVTVEDLVAEGDRVAMRLTIRGSHEGELMGVPPTGTEVEFQNVIFHRMADGKIAERWVQPDVLGLLRQLDAIDEPNH